MAKTKQTPLITTRLAAADHLRFDQICRLEGKTRTDIARRALLEFLERYDQEAEDERQDKLTKALEAMEQQRRKDVERLAKLIVRATIDVGIINQVLWQRASEDSRDSLWSTARTYTLERLKVKRQGGDAEATEIARSAISSET